MNIDECIKEGFLKKVKPDKDEIKKEIKESDSDILDAKDSFENNRFKWCIIQIYYSMFHSAKAVLISQGYKERRHFAVEVVLRELVKNKKLESYFLNDFKSVMFAREEADYSSVYSKERAENSLKIAEEFNSKMLELLGKL